MGRVAAKSELLIALVMALGLGAGRATWAQEEMAIDNFAGVGIRAMGMGGAFVGVADDFTAGGLKRYESEWKAVLGRELRIGYYARRMYEVLGDRQVESLVNEVLSANIRQEFLNSEELRFDWHSGVIMKAIGHRDLGAMIRSFGPTVAPFLQALSKSRAG